MESEELRELEILSKVIGRMEKELSYLKSWVESKITRNKEKIAIEQQQDHDNDHGAKIRIESIHSLKKTKKVEVEPKKDTVDIEGKGNDGVINFKGVQIQTRSKKIQGPSTAPGPSASASTSSRLRSSQVEIKLGPKSNGPSSITRSKIHPDRHNHEQERFDINSTNDENGGEYENKSEYLIIEEVDQKSLDNRSNQNLALHGANDEVDDNNIITLDDDLSFDINDHGHLEVQNHESFFIDTLQPRKKARIGEVESAIRNIPISSNFLSKLWALVNDEATDNLISWSEDGASFIIKDATKITIELFPILFRHNNFSSFIRQLNRYGFRKINVANGKPIPYEKICLVFAHEYFIRGHDDYLKNIKLKNISANDSQ